MSTATALFTGFGDGAIAFLEGLERNNSKEWFDANRSTHHQEVAAPMKALVVAIGEGLRERVGHRWLVANVGG